MEFPTARNDGALDMISKAMKSTEQPTENSKGVSIHLGTLKIRKGWMVLLAGVMRKKHVADSEV